MPDNRLPTQSELAEFRNALALARAHYHNETATVRLLTQLVENPSDHVYAIRTLVHILLMELDGPKRDADEVLTQLIENAAIADARA